jgi:hypothetical protein
MRASMRAHDAASAVDARAPDTLNDARVAMRDAASDAAHADAARADAGPSCALSGSFAALVDFDVAWVPTTIAGFLPVLEGGRGSIRMYATVRLDALGNAVVKPCGTTVPDFEGTDPVGGELYGGDIPNAAWDAPSMPSFTTRYAMSCATPGCGYVGQESTFVIGARSLGSGLWPTAGGWSASGEFEATDDDGDGRSGITMITRGPPQTDDAGRPYAYPPVGVAQYGRARKLMLAMSLRVKLDGTLRTCDLIEGSSSKAEVHVSAIGCTGVLDGDSQEIECSADVASFVDANLPVWTVQSASFKMMRLPQGAGCYYARTILMQ